MIEVTKAGQCDLVMDMGRPGWAAFGVPAGGAADPSALAAANYLVGNTAGAVGLEIALSGPTLRFPRGGVAALAGACFDGARDSGLSLRWNETLALAPGETVRLGRAETGCRCWLAVRGGLAVPFVLGSGSTFLPGGFGGHQGRALRVGDSLAFGRADQKMEWLCTQPPTVDAGAPLRVVAGPQVGLFGDKGLLVFFGGAYRVGRAVDRRGLRLVGVPVAHTGKELPSQGVLPGAIQIPPDGQPIILGWDGPATGGYPVIATVIAADWPRLAQLRTGDVVRFETIAVESARALSAGWPLGALG